ISSHNDRVSSQSSVKAVAIHEGLLSLPVSFEIPAESRQHSFVYRGEKISQTSPVLRLKYLKQTEGRMVFLSIVTGILLLGWSLRGLPVSVQWWGVFLIIVIPMSMMWIVPYLYQIVFSAILTGG